MHTMSREVMNGKMAAGCIGGCSCGGVLLKVPYVSFPNQQGEEWRKLRVGAS